MNVLYDIYSNSLCYFPSLGNCVHSSQILCLPHVLCTDIDQEKAANCAFLIILVEKCLVAVNHF